MIMWTHRTERGNKAGFIVHLGVYNIMHVAAVGYTTTDVLLLKHVTVCHSYGDYSSTTWDWKPMIGQFVLSPVNL